jgi:hypothetical protein
MSKQKNPELPHLINLVVGDWSNDGHSQSDTITISSNLEKADVEKAYKAGAKKLKLDVTKDVATDYEDGALSIKQWKKLAKAGLTLETLYDGSRYDIGIANNAIKSEEENINLYPDVFVNIWIFVVQQGNPDFKFEVSEDDSPNINIGGYGLFS